MRIFFKGFNFSQDGPGNRLVYHLQGCNMRCPWCSNPEGMPMSGGKEYTPLQILRECESCRPMFFGGGGVTFTGGEATLQADELEDVLMRLREAGIHTAIETNGTSPQLERIGRHVDYLIMDFKHYDGELHKKHTGVGNENVKANFERHCKEGRQQHIRIPLINGVNTESPEGFASYFSRFDTKNTVFEFLPYHEYGREKWVEEYTVENGFVSEDTVNAFKEAFKQYGLRLINT